MIHSSLLCGTDDKTDWTVVGKMVGRTPQSCKNKRVSFRFVLFSSRQGTLTFRSGWFVTVHDDRFQYQMKDRLKEKILAGL